MAKKVTKRAIVASILAASICTSMLIGTTYAWFTDSVTSSGNIIKSGTLQVGMSWAEGRYDPTSEEGDDSDTDSIVWYDVEQNGTDPMFYYDLWEPGYVQARHIQVFNKGSLALKYNLTILPAENSNYDPDAADNIANVIDVYFYDPAQTLSDRAELTDANKIGTLKDLIADPTILAAGTQGHLSAKAAGATEYPNKTVTLALKMQETAGNDYQDKQIDAGFDVKLYATQWTEETDTFDDKYDKLATYDADNVGSPLVLVNNDTAATTKVTIPAAAAKINDIFALSVENTDVSTDDQGKTTLSLDITLTKNGVAVDTPNGDIEYEVEVYVGEDLNVTAVNHNGTAVEPFTYDETTGIVKFKVTSFSPFTVEYYTPQQITFDGNGATSGSMDAQKVYTGVETTLTANGFTRTGYAFVGWATSADGAVAYADQASYKMLSASDVTLYAQWELLPSSISLDKTFATFLVNETVQLSATVLSAEAVNKSVTWTSSNEDVVSVEDGLVTAKAVGEATITAKTVNGITATCTVVIPNHRTITVGTVLKNGETIYAESTTYFRYKATSGNIIAKEFPANRVIHILGSNTSYSLKVVYSAGSYMISTMLDYTNGVGNGVRIASGAGTQEDPFVLEHLVVEATGIEIEPSYAVLPVSNTRVQINATVVPEGANTNITWTSSDTNVARVDSKGKVMVRGAGYAIITGTTVNGKTATYGVNYFESYWKRGTIKYIPVPGCSETNPVYFTGAATFTLTTDQINFVHTVEDGSYDVMKMNGHELCRSAQGKVYDICITGGNGTADNPYVLTVTDTVRWCNW